MVKLFDDIQIIKSNGKRDLPEIIPQHLYDKWFSNKQKGKIFVLNKGRCGNGGTMGFINYAKTHFLGLTIIVPNVSIVKSKEKDINICSVYGDAPQYDTSKNIRICTWDKHEEVLNYTQVGMQLIDDKSNIVEWFRSLLVVDEYHKLVDDSNYRKICSKVVQTILTTNHNVVLMSATPNKQFIDFLKKYSNKQVVEYEVEYDDRIPQILGWVDKEDKKLTDIIITIINNSRQPQPHKGKPKGENVVFFYSNLKRVSEIVNQLQDNTDIEVLCSKKNKDKDVPNYSEKYDNKKRIHFLTSAYFTGMDIMEHVDKVVIIVGNGCLEMSYTPNEIKQILGRMRMGYSGSYIIKENNIMRINTYANINGKISQYETVINDHKIKKDSINYIQNYLNYLYYSEKKNSMEGWENFESFKNMISIFPEYTTKILKIGAPIKIKKKRDISFKKYQEARLKGNKIPYRYSKVCEKFIEIYGLEKFGKMGRNDVMRLMNLNEKQGDLNIEKASKKDLYEAFIGDGYFNGTYLMSVLDYLGERCEWDELEMKMMTTFDCLCVEKTKESRRSQRLFLCLNGELIYQSKDSNIEKITEYNVSLRISPPFRTTQAITTPLHRTNYTDMRYFISSDKNFEKIVRNFYQVLYEHPEEKEGIKSDPKWSKVFNDSKNYQQMISDFYKPTKEIYRHIISECSLIDTLIVDIDNSIPFSEFKNKYNYYKYTAFPSISNMTEDWTKYRVIFYLPTTLQIPNDKLEVLKILRLSVCKYEDKLHNLGAYINGADWQNKYENDGELINYSQDMVSYLDGLTKTLDTYISKPKYTSDGTIIPNKWTLEKCISYAKEKLTVGNRNAACFAILNHIEDKDIEEFDRWYLKNYPDSYEIRWVRQRRNLKK